MKRILLILLCGCAPVGPYIDKLEGQISKLKSQNETLEIANKKLDKEWEDEHLKMMEIVNSKEYKRCSDLAFEAHIGHLVNNMNSQYINQSLEDACGSEIRGRDERINELNDGIERIANESCKADKENLFTTIQNLRNENETLTTELDRFRKPNYDRDEDEE